MRQLDDCRLVHDHGFYPHASCEARPTAFLIGNSVPNISTHTSLARRDLNFDHMYRHDRNFYSHAPCGARRFTRACLDVISRFLLTRPVRGATTQAELAEKSGVFLLTRPVRGATPIECYVMESETISTHTPLARRDLFCNSASSVVRRFLLTRLLRGATTPT